VSTVLVAGASGALGRRVARLLAARGQRVRALTRDPARTRALGDAVAETAIFTRAGDRAALDTALRGVDRVFSCAGASVLPGLSGWRGFRGVDLPVNQALVEAAARAGVARFTYVSVYHTPAMRRLAYVDAHERVADALAASGLPHTVVRPTGFYSAISMFVDLARRGPLPLFGDPAARTNPIGDDDLAEVCTNATLSDGAAGLDVGGPEVLSRRQMLELAFAALGKPARFVRVPGFLLSMGAFFLRAFHPRNADLIAFFHHIAQHDLIAPTHGSLLLGDALKAAARV
jgi:uncharacterized protein YbjT (DUF2867 family)